MKSEQVWLVRAVVLQRACLIECLIPSLFLGLSSCNRGTSIMPITSLRSSSSSRKKGARMHRYVWEEQSDSQDVC